MIPILTILCFVVIHLRDDMLADWSVDDAPGGGLIGLAVPIGMAALFAIAQVACVRARRAMVGGGGFTPYVRAERVVGLARTLGFALFAIGVLGLDWLSLVRGVVGNVVLVDELVAMSPFLALLIGLWWSASPLDLLVREAMLIRSLDAGEPVHPLPTRAQALWANVRHQLMLGLLPGGLATAWGECVPRLAALATDQLSSAPRSVRELIEPAIALLGLVLIMTVAPAMLRWLWDVVRITEGEIHAMSKSACERHGVRVVGPFLWRTHGVMVNAAILGVFWPLRYLLLTDALLEALPRRQLEGVLAHEVAHVRLAHIAWLAGSVVAAASALGWVLGALLWLWPVHPGGRDDQTLAMVATAGSIAVLALTLVVLGFVSRRFEWQADAFAVRHLCVSDGNLSVVSPEAAAHMSGALAKVALANGVPESRWGFRHGSIADRRNRVEQLVGVALEAFEIDRVVRRIKWAIALTIVLSLGAVLFPALV